jgi:hypothetical protein
LRYPTDVVVP